LSALELLLRREGHEVCTARDGLSAFAMIHTTTPDLILLDIGLPVVGGIELCVAIRQTPGFSATPIVMLTGSHKHIDARLAHEFGADAYMTKPFDEDVLISVISGFVAGSGTPLAAPQSQEAA
jgi:DNA-binding response OmpR family regulator